MELFAELPPKIAIQEYILMLLRGLTHQDDNDRLQLSCLRCFHLLQLQIIRRDHRQQRPPHHNLGQPGMCRQFIGPHILVLSLRLHVLPQSHVNPQLRTANSLPALHFLNKLLCICGDRFHGLLPLRSILRHNPYTSVSHLRGQNRRNSLSLRVWRVRSSFDQSVYIP